MACSVSALREVPSPIAYELREVDPVHVVVHAVPGSVRVAIAVVLLVVVVVVGDVLLRVRRVVGGPLDLRLLAVVCGLERVLDAAALFDRDELEQQVNLPGAAHLGLCPALVVDETEI